MRFISVVITAYNEEKDLPKTLETVFAQNFPKENYEVVVVDNNSKDKTAEIAKKLGARVIEEKKQGYVYALSRGMSEARGEVVAVTDSDTLLDKNWLSEIDKTFSKDEVVAATGLANINTSNVLLKVLASFAFYLYAIINFSIGKPQLMGFNLMVRKNIFEKAGGLNTEYQMSPDIELGMRLSKFGKVVFNPKIIAYTSTRRWEDGYVSTAIMYIKGYFYATWIRKSPPVRQKPVR